MHARALIGLIVATSLAACSGSQNEAEGKQAASDTTASAATGHEGHVMGGAAGDSSMAGMDHSQMAGDSAGGMAGMDHSGMNMGGAAAPAAGAGMAGMDHSQMYMGGTSSAPASSGSMAGMDHSNMPGMSAGSSAARAGAQPMAGMDHSNMPGMQPTRATTSAARPSTGMAGMDHSNMPGMSGNSASPARAPAMAEMDHSSMPGMSATPPTVARGAVDPGTQKLDALVAELVRDSVVQRRIQQDPALREAWSDPEVRAEVLNPQ